MTNPARSSDRLDRIEANIRIVTRLMNEPLKRTGIRIEGTEAQIQEAIQRLRHVLDISAVSKLYDSLHHESVKRCYLGCYTYEKNSLLDQLEAAHRDRDELQSLVGELEQKIMNLQEQLKMLPQPEPGSAVLSPRHQTNV